MIKKRELQDKETISLSAKQDCYCVEGMSLCYSVLELQLIGDLLDPPANDSEANAHNHNRLLN